MVKDLENNSQQIYLHVEKLLYQRKKIKKKKNAKA